MLTVTTTQMPPTTTVQATTNDTQNTTQMPNENIQSLLPGMFKIIICLYNVGYILWN